MANVYTFNKLTFIRTKNTFIEETVLFVRESVQDKYVKTEIPLALFDTEGAIFGMYLSNPIRTEQEVSMSIAQDYALFKIGNIYQLKYQLGECTYHLFFHSPDDFEEIQDQLEELENHIPKITVYGNIEKIKEEVKLLEENR